MPHDPKRATERQRGSGQQRPAWPGNAAIGAVAIDTAAVLVFVAAGRNSHDADTTVDSLAGVAAPFLIGLAVGWLVTPGARRDPLAWRSAIGIWIATVGIGLLLRRFAWDRSTATSFAVVTALVLGLLLFGWRAIWSLGSGRTAVRSPPPPSKAGR